MNAQKQVCLRCRRKLPASAFERRGVFTPQSKSRICNECLRIIRPSKKERSTKQQVSDHALVRWLQRRYGIDVDQLRQELIEFSGVQSLLAENHNCEVSKDGLTIVIHDGTVVTVKETGSYDT